MKRLKSAIEKSLFKNGILRMILYTSKFLQVELLRIKSGTEIDLESHSNMDQFVGFKGGKGKCIIEGQEYVVENGDVIVIPAGSGNEVTKFDFHKKTKSMSNFFPAGHEDDRNNETSKTA
jgi:mannose-6-phosphate isomerase-like protein (cupin superfamily)